MPGDRCRVAEDQDSGLRPSRLASECTCLDCILSLNMPGDRCRVAEDQDSDLRPSRRAVAAVACIDEAMHCHCIAPWLRHVPGNGLFNSSVEVVPIVFLEHSLAYHWVLSIESQFPLRVKLQVSKHIM